MAPKLRVVLKRVGAQFRHKNDPHHPEHDHDNPDHIGAKMKQPLVETLRVSVRPGKPLRLSVQSLTQGIFSRQRSSEASHLEPAFPPEIIELIASFLTQKELVVFSRVSWDAYTAAERYLYRRPFTRRFDKLLRTLEKHPYKANLIK
jgi:hypothetical protein